jgi:hypothetical protein
MAEMESGLAVSDIDTPALGRRMACGPVALLAEIGLQQGYIGNREGEFYLMGELLRVLVP